MDKVLYNALLSYFKAEKIRVSPSELELQLFSHPHTPSLLAVSETLDFLKIPNVAAQIEPNEMAELPKHFIAFLEDPERGSYFSHVQQNGRTVYLGSDNIRISKEDFKNKWNGIVLVAEQEKSPFPTHDIWPFWIGPLTAFLLAIILWPNGFALSFSLLGLLGLYISEELFETVHDRGSDFGRRICGPPGESGCAKIARSRKYQLGAFSLNDLLFAFFMAGIGSLILYQKVATGMLFIYSLSLLAVLSTILVQAFVERTWCRLCLLSSAIIMVQALVVFYVLLGTGRNLDTTDFLIFLQETVSFGLFFWIALLGVHTFRSHRSRNYELGRERVELLQFKRLPETIRRAFADAGRIEFPEGADQLVLGGPSNGPTVFLVLSTTCGFCKNAFQALHAFYKNNKSKCHIKLVFNHYDTQPSPKNNLAAGMIYAYRTLGVDQFLRLMDQWFELQDVDLFLSRQELEFTEAEYKVLVDQREWSKKNGLFHTPILIVGTKIVPPYYDATFLGDIMESLEVDLENS